MLSDGHLVWIIQQIYRDLPAKRDWLNPNLEKLMVEVSKFKPPEVKILDALDIIGRYGGIDGSHHKAWVIDQVVRCLMGDVKIYDEWVKDIKTGIDGPESYDWDVGIAP